MCWELIEHAVSSILPIPASARALEVQMRGQKKELGLDINGLKLRHGKRLAFHMCSVQKRARSARDASRQ